MPTIAQIKSEVVQDGAQVIHLQGEVDSSNLSEIENAITTLINDINNKVFILECSELMFIDSKVVGYLASIHTTLSHSQRKLFIASPNTTINDILTLVGLKSIVPTFSTVEEAISNI